MGPHTSSRSRLRLASAALALLLSCGPATPAQRTLDPNADVVVPYTVAGGGVIRFTVRPRYTVGQPVRLSIDIIAGSAQIRGPLAGRVLASGAGGEQVVRTFPAGSLDAVDIAPNTTGHTTFAWDAADDAGSLVPAETYSLALDFDVGGETVRFGSVLQLVRP